MDIEYRRELKKHLMKSFQTNKSSRSQKSPRKDIMQKLARSYSTDQSAASRTIQALLDDDYYTTSSDQRSIYRNDDAKSSTDDDQCQQQDQSSKSKLQKDSENLSVMSRNSDHGNDHDHDHDQEHRIIGGENNGQSYQSITSSRTAYTNASTLLTKSSTFKRRTSRELRKMVKSQCKLVESLNIIEITNNDSNTNYNNDDNENNDNENDNNSVKLPPSMVLWKSKKVFNSSVDLHSDVLLRSEPSSMNLSGKENQDHSAKFFSATCEKFAGVNAESIVRDRFTGPLIREVERVYVQNITTTADLLKKLDCMPGDIDKALAEKKQQLNQTVA